MIPCASPQEARFRGINVLSFDLDMPERTTADYENSRVNPNVRAALTAALKDDEQLELEAEENLPSMGLGGSGWMPGAADGGLGAGLSAGLSKSMHAAKLTGVGARREGGARRSANSSSARKASTRRDEDLDVLLNGGEMMPALSAKEEFYDIDAEITIF